MNNMLETLKDRSQRFTTTEIQAEILRQDIQKLENAQPLGDNDLRRLKILKQRMADIEEPSKLNAQGRVLMRRYLGMMNEDRTWIDGPSNVDGMLDDVRKWMDAMEEERRRRRYRHMSSFKQAWPVADWEGRVKMLRWFGRYNIRQFAKDKPLLYIARAAMACAKVMVKRRL